MRAIFHISLYFLALWTFAAELASAARQHGEDQQVLLPPAPIIEAPSDRQPAHRQAPQEFTLRHIYHRGSHEYPNLHRKVDIHPDTLLLHNEGRDHAVRASSLEALQVASKSYNIQRMVDRSAQKISSLLDAGSRGEQASLPSSAWTIDEVPGPNVTDKKSVLSFAYMAANAYVTVPRTGEWQDVKGAFNYTEDFGWESDGLRGHIFADTTNSTIVIGLKGTSFALFDGAGTTGNDKLNDNLFGSCCCAQGGPYFWKQVCDCQSSAYTCNNTCLVKSLRDKAHYYHAAKDLYENVTARYPNADVWLTGHSLGGVVSSLLGLTYGLPTVTFEAFPDALAAGRLGLPTPPGYHIGSHQSRVNTGVYHFGHTADPVYMGSCNSASSGCTIAGYAFQSQCHTGSACTYDTVGDFGWRVGVGTHTISSVIRDVIKKYDTVPTCEEDVECVDCYNWKFFESNGSETTTSRSSSSTRTTTRTATCQTPGWWGCLDETTSSPITMTSTLTTTTCLTPGWFGCKDGSTTLIETTTITTQTDIPASTGASTSTISSTTSSTSSTTTCETPGWFGCNDPTSTSSTTTTAEPSTTASPPAKTTAASCTSKEWFGLICVDPSPDVHASPSPTPKP